MGKNTRKLFCVMLMLLMQPILANAEMVSISELNDQVAQMGRWEKTYEAHGYAIEVDIPVIVPNVEAFPVLKVEHSEVLSENALAYIFENTEVERSDRYDEVRYGVLSDEEYGLVKGDTLRIQRFLQDHDIWLQFNRPKVLWKAPRGSKKARHQYLPWELEDDVAYAEDNPLTYSQAAIVGQNVIQSLLAHDKACVRMVFAHDRYRNNTSGKLVKDSPIGRYELYYSQVFHGIPMLSRVDDTIYQGELVYLQDGTYEVDGQINIVIFGMREVEIFTNGLVKEKSIEVDDVPLASLNSVIKAIENEIAAGHIRKIHSLELGYSAYRDDEDDTIAWLYPTWLLRCEYYDNPSDEMNQLLVEEDSIGGTSEFRNVYITGQQTKLLHWDVKSTSPKEDDFFLCPAIAYWSDF